MHKFLVLVSLLSPVLCGGAWAQASPPLEKKNYNYSEWTKGRYAAAGLLDMLYTRRLTSPLAKTAR
jgi:hypothetical protein